MGRRAPRISRPGRAFVVLGVGLVGLAGLAVAGRGDQKTVDSADLRLARSLEHRQAMDGLRAALMPLLQYVKAGQPRDAINSLQAETGPPPSPDALRTVRDGATEALGNLAQLAPTGELQRGLPPIRAATALYAEAAGLAADAADPAQPATARRELAGIGGRVLQMADALFDQGRQAGRADLESDAGSVPTVILDRAEGHQPGGAAVQLRAEADRLANALAQTNGAVGDRDRPARLRALARTLPDTEKAHQP